MALKRVRSSAGIAAHNAPPIAPATTIAGNNHAVRLVEERSATPLAAAAPMMNCPSAPMFHTLARKPTARPIAISISGVALRNSSEMP